MNVDFYILATPSRLKCWQFACKLLEKCYADGKRAYVLASSLEEAERFDSLLWTFREDAFIPHALYQPANEFAPAIQISTSSQTLSPQEVLVNLSDQLPTSFNQYHQVIEIVFDSPAVQQLARERFRHYREHGCELTTHKLSEAEL